MTEYRMVYDSGSRMLKCAISDELGNIVALQSIELEVIKSKDGLQREWNHKNYWDNLIDLTKVTIKSAKINPKQIKYITASSIRPSCVFADENNNAVYIGASFELRGFDYAEEIEDEFFEKSGKTFYQSSGHFPSLLFIPARYKYFQEETNNDERIKEISQYLPIESWILIKFGGEIHTNFLSAGESGFFDLDQKIWHPLWTEILDLPDYFFPWPVLPGEVIGLVNEQWQYDLGLSPETKLVAGCPDTQAALLGCQSIKKDSIAAVLGTTTPVQAITEELIIPEEEKTWSGLMMIKNLCNNYYLEANTGMTGQILKWIGAFLYSDEDISLKQRFKRLDEAYLEFDQYEQQNSLSEIEKIRVQSLLGPAPLSNTQMGMAPGLFTFHSPGGVDEIELTKKDFIGATFDNILFAVTRNIEYAIELANIKEPSISIMGGVTRNPVLVQRFSDLLNIPITTPKNYETTVQGLLILCDIAAKEIRNYEDLLSRNKKLQLLRKINPRKDMNQKLQLSYQSWLSLFKKYYK
jgi:sugar (pentulose or hexulose) kinase